MKDPSARILDAAVELAEQGGFERVKARDVAARAGVTLRTLYRRFRSKEEILAAALARSVGAVEDEALALAGDGAEARLVALLRLMTRALLARPQLARAVIRAMCSGVAGTAPPVLAFQGRTSALVLAALRGGAGDGFPTEAELTVVMLALQVWFATLIGWSIGLFDEAALDGHVARAVAVVLRGAGLSPA